MDHPIEVGWFKSSDGYWGVSCQVNDLFRKHRDKIWRCQPLIEIIVERCRLIYQSLNFHLSWMEVYFTENGPGIDIDGDRCGVFPMGGGMGDYVDHNIDTADQAFCLFLCLETAMTEVENALEVWEKHDDWVLGPVPAYRPQFRFAKDLTKWGLFRARVFYREEAPLDYEKYIWAKGAIQAEDIAERQPNLFDGDTFVDGVTAGPPLILSSLIVQESED